MRGFIVIILLSSRQKLAKSNVHNDHAVTSLKIQRWNGIFAKVAVERAFSPDRISTVIDEIRLDHNRSRRSDHQPRMNGFLRLSAIHPTER